jgi:DNA topoisomerase-1
MKKQEIAAKLKKDFAKEKEAEDFLLQSQNTEFKVLNVETKPGTRSASAPFTTSTLQQEASNRSGIWCNFYDESCATSCTKKGTLLI